MSHDPDLLDTIKRRFARKSSAQLQEIVQAGNHERWSPEAIEAAGEVLRDRMSGLTQEPEVAEEEPPAPPYHYEPKEITLGVLAGLLIGHLVIPYYRTIERPDLPVPFGPKMAWLAMETTDTDSVATALGLQETQATTWVGGIDGARQAFVFVTPPLADWTLAVGAALFPPDRADAFVKPLLERLSQPFGDAQYFCTHRDVELHIWARARKGRLVRGYGWLGEKATTLWDEGPPTKEERALGFDTSPNEEFVMQLASLWSIDPTSLDQEFEEPATGIRGGVPWAMGRSG
ncbi:MAG: hypothetical protein ACJ8FY_07675 [Gemmataceae bacterium]